MEEDLKTPKNRVTRFRGGQRLRERRVRLGLTLREVEAHSRIVADELKSRRFEVPFGRLSEMERNGHPPNIFRLYTLARIYRLRTSELLKWYGVPHR